MKQYQFSLKDECMKELPSKLEPNHTEWEGGIDSPFYVDLWSGYQKHLASLQSIPVPKDYLSSFIDGKIYNEDEFEICKYQGETFAVSIPKQKVDDTEPPLLNLGFEIKFIKNELLPANTAMVSKDIYEILKNNYQNK